MRISDWSSDVCSSDLLFQYGLILPLFWLFYFDIFLISSVQNRFMKPLLRKVNTGHNYSFSVREDIGPHLDNHWYYHPEIELTLMRRGSGMRFIGDHIDRFREGDVILLGSNLPHMWKCDAIYFEQQPGLQTEAVVIHFREDFWGSTFLELPDMNGVRKLLDRAKRGINIYVNNKPQIRHTINRKSVVQGKSVSVILALGVRRI